MITLIIGVALGELAMRHGAGLASGGQVLGGVLAGLLVQAMASRVLGSLLRPQQPRWLGLLIEGGSQAVILAISLAWVSQLGLFAITFGSGVLRSLPMLALLLVHLDQWGLARRAARGVPEPRPTWRERLHRLGSACRLGLLPIVALLGIFDLLKLGCWQAGLSEDASLWVHLLAMVLVPMLVMPWLLALVWGAKPLPQGELLQQIHADCARMGVRVGRVMYWPRSQREGLPPFLNAAVVGMVGRLRYVFFSEDLLNALDRSQVRAVLGHELGHARHQHLLTYMLFFFATLLWLQLLVGWLPSAGAFGEQPWRDGLVLLVGLVVALRVLFAPLSRMCEREADLAGAELVADVRPMQAALCATAAASGEDPTQPSWRHGSIAERVQYLEKVRLDPGLGWWHHLRVQRLRFMIMVALVAALVAMVLSPQHGSLPGLAQMESQDRDLATALRKADAGDSVPLTTWLSSAEPRQRLSLGVGLLNAFASDASQLLLYRWKGRLRAFGRISTGEKVVDVQMMNTLAYALVGDGTPPTAADLVLAGELANMLERSVSKEAAPEIWDTIGCVRFRQGKRDQASESFSRAAKLVAEQETKDVAEAARLQSFRELLTKRIAACASPMASLPLEPEVQAERAKPALSPSQPASLEAKPLEQTPPPPSEPSPPPAGELPAPAPAPAPAASPAPAPAPAPAAPINVEEPVAGHGLPAPGEG